MASQEGQFPKMPVSWQYELASDSLVRARFALGLVAGKVCHEGIYGIRVTVAGVSWAGRPVDLYGVDECVGHLDSLFHGRVAIQAA